MTDAPRGTEPDIEEKVAFLRRPEAYPEPTREVEVVETHMSWVFLTDAHVYKLKKPVRYDYLDFGTVAAREGDCREEVRLNRRLAPLVYLGVEPLSAADGGLRLGGEGDVVDWLVKMRRLPRARMLDHLIGEGAVTPVELRRLGRVLGDFYARAERAALSKADYRDRFLEDIAANHRELGRPDFGLPRDLVERVADGQRRFLEHRGALLDARVDARLIVEGHGDLRPEHVCLLTPPVVIDCIEFNRNFRILDPADELAFLAMDSERLGGPDVGPIVLDAYTERRGDRPPPELFAFYRSLRAGVRAKIAIWHNKEPDVAEPEKWRQRALDYLRLAERDLAAID